MLRVILIVILVILVLRIVLLSRMKKERTLKRWHPGDDFNIFRWRSIQKSLKGRIDYKEVNKEE
ncbi:MAG: hypothetical protein ACUVTX_03625 [Bacteroidales bacterium]